MLDFFIEKLLGLFSDVSKDTAVNIEDVTVNCVGCFRGKENCGTCKLFGLEPSVGGCLSTDELIERMTGTVSLTLAKRSGLRGFDVAGAKAVTLNVVLAVLGADVSGEHLETTLSGCVSGNCFTTKL